MDNGSAREEIRRTHRVNSYTHVSEWHHLTSLKTTMPVQLMGELLRPSRSSAESPYLGTDVQYRFEREPRVCRGTKVLLEKRVLA